MRALEVSSLCFLLIMPLLTSAVAEGTRTETCGYTFLSKTYTTRFCRKGPCREHCDDEGGAGGTCTFILPFVRCICDEPCS
uniref:Knottin scorpion toxin-like domain-containing protein n=1 Tax=Oryza brachyantha TaxID=4533 RepID=J3NEW7_ORYBR